MSGDAIIQHFIQHVKHILNEEGTSDAGLARIAEAMHGLTAHGAAIAPVEHAHGTTQRQGLHLLHADSSGLTLVHGLVNPDIPTPVHSHGTWGVIGIYAGRDRYEIWRRNDAGVGAGPADVAMVEERILNPGDVLVLPPPPQDIHVQQAHGEEVARELILFGKNVLQQLPYLLYDPDRGCAEEFHPRQ